MRRIAAVTVLILFTSLNAVDGMCCSDGCTRQEDASGQSSPHQSEGICVLCLGGVKSSPPEDVSPGAFITTRIAPMVIPTPETVSPDPPDHPPRY